MSVGGEALLYNCRPLDRPESGPVYPHMVSVHNSGKRNSYSSKRVTKTSRSMSTCVPSSSYEALRYAVAALNRLDDFNCEKIGAGFFSEVFKVTHRTTGQVMVLKMNTSLSNRANMLREVQLMNRLSHENILRFMGVCVHEGQLHALTEFINGGSLEQLLNNKRIELSWETRIKLSLDIARGMCYLHSRGVFHRDLTSKNVLIKINSDDEMTAVVGDFGLAEKIPDSRDRSQRLPIVGSPYWMAPECLKGKWYNEKADVFSYGIILCEIIARIEADPDILPRTENFGVDYVAFSEMCPDCPPQFLELAFTSCRISPDSRPNFSEVVQQLEKMLNVISSMKGGSHLFYPPVVYSTPCWDDGDNIDSVRAIFANGWSRLNTSQNSPSPTKNMITPYKVRNSAIEQPPPVTPKHVGEVMSLQDPHYKPFINSQNPFASLPRFWKGKKFLEHSFDEADLSHSLSFTSQSESPIVNTQEKDSVSPASLQKQFNRQLSKSLPTSPVLPKKPLKFPNLPSEGMDSPRSVSPGLFSSPSSLSPFEPEESFSGYNSVQEQMSGCKLEDSCDQLQELHKINLDIMQSPQCDTSNVVTFRTKTPSLCAKLRRSSGESGFFSVGDRNSTCDLSLESYQAPEDMPSWTTDSIIDLHANESPSDTDDSVLGCSRKQQGSEDMLSWTMNSSVDSHANESQSDTDDTVLGGSRKRPSSCYSDDSCCCCTNPSNCCEIRMNSDCESDRERVRQSKHVYSIVCQKPSVQTPLTVSSCCTCKLCVAGTPCQHSNLVISTDVSSQNETLPHISKSSLPFAQNPMKHHSLSKTCDKGSRIIKCMRTSID